ncbi:tetratricopeptide repeat protein [Chitinibacter bivalviorum]|uniref:Tetratricopeptide repeat protein n=1 Tax=Chitinibacter bivalviorum TaxID=2739434 RepID=A0A7H9BJM0_9NEIS|nr:tetratricopeptide repeat protein [Chitinibacter bivalviorum]QLG88763.1 tetratricopeptide repeat protein [Chitinibacter bivalviorum]
MKQIVLICGLISSLALASGGGGPAPQSSANQTSQQLIEVERLVKAQQWTAAEAQLKALRVRASDQADVWNWSGYVARKSGRLSEAFPYYERALQINPRHLGAHEYLGEAYLQVGDVGHAQAQLDILRTLCGQCEEAEDLAVEISKSKP